MTPILDAVTECVAAVGLFLVALAVLGLIANFIDGRAERRDAYRRNHWRTRR